MKRLPAFLIIGIAAALGGYLLYRSAAPFLQQVDLRLKDVRFRVRGAQKPDPRVAVVAIDSKSIRELGRWPWSREVTGRLVTNLKRYGASVSALDIVFSEPQGEAPDAALARAVADAGNVVLGYFFRNEEEPSSTGIGGQMERSRLRLVRLDPGVEQAPLAEFRSVDATIPRIAEGASGFGFFNVIPDEDGLFRRAPLVALYDGQVQPSLSLTALARFLGREPVLDVAPFGVRGVSMSDLPLPVSESGELTLNYYGPAGSFATFSAVDVIRERLAPDILKGKLAFVGATEMGIYDVRATPFDATLPGVEIHATVAANALERRFLMRDGRTVALELSLLLLLPLLCALIIGVTSRPLAGVLWLGTLTIGYLGLNLFLFSRYSLDLSLLFPLAPLFVSYVGAETYRSLVVDRKGRHLKKAFSSYVSPAVADRILKNPDRLTLGGEKREVSVLFSDIRNFTTISESLSPETLVKLLNSYLGPMTRIVMDERGTLDKYIGDAVMAIFNAPLDVPGHPACACRAAVRMVEELDELNRAFAAEGLSPIDIGVGIHTGEVVVGNMGADIRFDYTAIGDTVNLASRLEGLTKQYGVRIIVSGATREAAGDGFSFREIDLVRVKGKQKPVAVNELMVDNRGVIAPFAEALGLYRRQDFAGALRLFSDLAEEGDRASALYAERCREFLANPPDEGWDGVYTARTK